MHPFDGSRRDGSFPRSAASLPRFCCCWRWQARYGPPIRRCSRATAQARARSDRRQGRTQTAPSRPRHHGRRRSSPKSRTRTTPTGSYPWRVSQRGGYACRCSATSRSEGVRPSRPWLRGSLDENLFDLRPADLARLPRNGGRGARPRAVAWSPARVVRMELRRPLQIVAKQTVEPPLWTIRIKGRRERAEIYADLSGKITLTNLRGTLRYQRLDLRAGGPDLDEWSSRYATKSRTAGRSGISKWRPNRSRSRPPRRQPCRAQRRSRASPPGSTASARRIPTFPGSAFPAPSPPTRSVFRRLIGSVCPRCSSAPATVRA